VAAVQGRRDSHGPEPDSVFLFTDLASGDMPSLLLVGPVIPRIASSGDYRLSPAPQQASQSEQTQQTPASPIGPDHNGSGDGLDGWGRRCRRVLRTVQWLLGEANSRQ